jgi:flagellar protein FlaJ
MSSNPQASGPQQEAMKIDAADIARVDAKSKGKKATPRKMAKIDEKPALAKKQPVGTAAKAKKKESEEEIKQKASPEQKKRMTILVISLSVGALLAILGLAGVEIPIGSIAIDKMGFVMLGLLMAMGPFSFYEGARINRIVKIEERLADFLRDLAESSRAGMTLHEAIRSSAKGDYGELSPEIRTMSIQISWGVSASEALNLFAARVKTPLVNRAVILINEAGSAGGDVSKVLEAAANDTKEIQLLQKERQIQMQMYVAIVFVSFVVFLVVILIIYMTFVPRMQDMAEDFREQSESEGAAAGGGMSMFNPQEVDFDEIKFIYLMAGLVQGIGDGLVAGLMGTGRIVDGAKYSFLMILIVFMIFTIVFPLAGF